MRRARGFTLIELIVAISICSLVIATAVVLIKAPMDGHFVQVRRAEMNDASSRLVRTLQADLQNALPNSVRINTSANDMVIQLLKTTDVVYYRDQPIGPPVDAARDLDFNAADTAFSAFGSFVHTTAANPLLVVNNAGVAGQDAYELANVVVNAAVPNGAGAGTHAIAFNPAFRFTGGSSITNRMFVLQGPVTYVCNLAAGTLRRFAGHAIASGVPANEAASQLTPAASVSLIASGITSCRIACAANSQRPCQRTLVVDITLERGTASDNEQVRLLHQFAVENTP